MQCVTAVEPQWLAELGPMFFSIKDSHTSRLEQRRKQKEEKSAMEEEMEEVRKAQSQVEANKVLKDKALRVKERNLISTPGSRREQGTPKSTPRRLGL